VHHNQTTPSRNPRNTQQPHPLKITLLLTLLLTLTLTTHAIANGEVCSMTDVWAGTPLSNGVGDGTGTESDPYLLSTSDHFFSVSDYYANLANKHPKPYEGGVPVSATDCWSAHFKQVEDVDLNSQTWTPIGVYYSHWFQGTVFNAPFGGTFDGSGFEIQSLTVSSSNYDTTVVSMTTFGLFGYADGATFKNMNLVNIDVHGDNTQVGGIAGKAISVSFTDNHVSGTISGTGDVGGIAGAANDSTFINNTNHGTINGNNNVGGIAGSVIATNTGTSTFESNTNNGTINGNNNVGGIAGVADASTVSNNTNNGTINGTGYVGGIAGVAYGSNFTNDTNTGAVTGTTYVGGLVGDLESESKIEFGVNLASIPVTGTSHVGGLVGWLYASQVTMSMSLAPVTATGDTAGGLVGYLVSGSAITDSLAMGTVTVPTSPASSLIGSASNDTQNEIIRSYATGSTSGSTPPSGLYDGDTGTPSITDSYWDTTTTGITDAAPDDPNNGTGLSTTDMQTLTTFQNAGWNIAEPTSPDYDTATWGICNDETYPFLRWAWEDDYISAYLTKFDASLPTTIPTCLTNTPNPETPKSSNANLATLTVTNGTLAPTFTPTTTRHRH